MVKNANPDKARNDPPAGKYGPHSPEAMEAARKRQAARPFRPIDADMATWLRGLHAIATKERATSE